MFIFNCSLHAFVYGAEVKWLVAKHSICLGQTEPNVGMDFGVNMENVYLVTGMH